MRHIWPSIVVFAALSTQGCAPCLRADPNARSSWDVAQTEQLPEAACALLGLSRTLSGAEDDCARSYLSRLEGQIFSHVPIQPSPMLVARIQAIGAVGGTQELTGQKVALLIRLSELSDEELLEGDAGGPGPDRAMVRLVALSELARSRYFLNVDVAREYLTSRLLAPRSDLEELLLSRHMALNLFSDALWGHPHRAEDNGGPEVLQRWVRDAAARVEQGTWDPVAFELLLRQVESIGTFCDRFGAGGPGRTLLERIVSVQGAVPLVEGHEPARQDLFLWATLALYDVNNNPGHVRPETGLRPIRAQAPVEVVRHVVEPHLHCVSSHRQDRATLDAFRQGQVPSSRESGGVGFTTFIEALGRHPEWLETEQLVGPWLLTFALSRAEREQGRAPLEVHLVEPVTAALRQQQLSAEGPPRAVLLEMIADVEAALEGGTTTTNLDVARALVQEIYVLGELGGRFGLASEVEALLRRLEGPLSAGCMTPLLRRAVPAARALQRRP